MFAYALIIFVAAAASLLTFFSGFGLGTLLSPIFAIFFPIHLAIAATAVVHFANNLFKLALMRRYINKSLLIKFSIPAGFAAIFGALTLTYLGTLPSLGSYDFYGKTLVIEPIKLSIGIIFILFALNQISGALKRYTFQSKYLVLGGLVSGFFGGLSGNQGAFRSAFLMKAGLSKESFIATGVSTACIVDAIRIGIYGSTFSLLDNHLESSLINLVIIAIASAFIGAYAGKKLLNKVTMNSIQYFVACLMIIVGICLCLGLL